MQALRTAYRILAFTFLLLLPFGLLSSCTIVPTGHVGVITTFGHVEPWQLDSGLSFIAPWRGATKMSVQTQEEKEISEVPTKEGLSITLEVSLLYSLQPSRASEVYQTIGVNYKDIVITPQFRSALRGVSVNYEAKDLYTAHRSEIEERLEKVVTVLLAERGINCEKVLLRSIELPKLVKSAVEEKLAFEQKSQQMKFVIEKERQEAERKRVEAKGIADSQEIIHSTLSDNYLRYLWIESLKTAAEHSGTIIYVPTGNDGLPFFKEVSGKAPVKK